MLFLTIFSIDNDGYHFLGNHLGFLVVVPAIVAVAFGVRRLFPGDLRAVIGSYFAFAMAGWMTLTTIISIAGMVSDHSQLRRQLAEGRFSLAEGSINKLSIGQYKGSRHPEVSFDVAGKRFQVSDFGTNVGFTFAHFRRSGLIEGHYVRVSYSGRTIMRLEVRQP
jgi:hypothetical protein